MNENVELMKRCGSDPAHLWLISLEVAQISNLVQ